MLPGIVSFSDRCWPLIWDFPFQRAMRGHDYLTALVDNILHENTQTGQAVDNLREAELLSQGAMSNITWFNRTALWVTDRQLLKL